VKRSRNIAVGRVWQETNTFNEVPTTLNDFSRHTYVVGDAALKTFRDCDDELAGFTAELDGSDVNYVPILSANCWCGGPVEEDVVNRFENDIREQFRLAGNIDGVIFSMHGAMVSEGNTDIEGLLTTIIREEIGPNIPMVLTLDHHANMTRSMINACDVLTGYRHCPHIDMRETGRRGARLLLDLIDGKVRPYKAYSKLPLVTPCEKFLTREGPMRNWFDLARHLEKNKSVIDISLFPVQPWIDVAELGWSVLVTTDQNPDLAEELAKELSTHAWERRESFFTRKYGPEEAVNIAAKATPGPVVIADGADATNGGSPGDSTCLLREMLNQKISCIAYMTMVDAEAVNVASAAGIGAEVNIDLGAHLSRRFHQPVKIRAIVERFSDGCFEVTGHIAATIDMGRCVLLRIGTIHIVVSEHAGPGHDPAVYRQIGLEPRDAQIVVVKSTVGHMDVFADIMTRSLACECPGPSPSYLDLLDYRQIPRPMYPFDKAMKWKP